MRDYREFSKFIRDIVPPHLPSDARVYEMLSAGDKIFSDLYYATKGFVKNVKDLDNCDVRFIPILADTLGLIHFDDCNVNELDVEASIQSDIINLYNKYSTTVGGVPYVSKETNMAYTSGFDNDSEFRIWLDNPYRLSSTLSCPSETDPVHDMICSVGEGSIYDIVNRCFVDGELTEEGSLVAIALGIDVEAIAEESLMAAMADKIYYNINKIRWHRQFIKDTVVRYQNKGTIGAIESMFTEYVLREFADYGFGSIGMNLSSTSGNDYKSGGRVSVKSFTDNRFNMEVVELLDPWDYFSGKEDDYVSPIAEDPSLDEVYNDYTNKYDIDKVLEPDLEPLINMFEDVYEREAEAVISFEPHEGSSHSVEDLIAAKYDGWPGGFPYPVEPQDINTEDPGNKWECLPDNVAGGIEITESGSGMVNTIKGYNQYRRVNTQISEWNEKAFVGRDEVFDENSECPADYYSYQQALKNGVSGIEINWGDFISNKRGTAATLQNALDQFEFDDIYHHFSYERQKPLVYLNPNELENHDDDHIYENLAEWLPYTTVEERTGINEFCPTPKNLGWTQAAPSMHVGKAVRDFEIDYVSNKYLLLVEPTEQILSSVEPSGGYISNPMNQTSGGVVLVGHNDLDNGEWKHLDLSALDDFINGSGISSMMSAGKSMMFTTDSGLVIFVKVKIGGILTGNEDSPVVHSVNQEFIKAKFDVDSQRVMFLSRDKDFGTYSLYSYDPNKHSISPHISNASQYVSGYNTEVVSHEVFSYDNPGFVLIHEDLENTLFHIRKYTPGLSETLIVNRNLAASGYTGETVGTHVDNKTGDLFFMYNTSGNDTIFDDLPDYTSAIGISNFARIPISSVQVLKPMDFVYKHYQHNGVGGGHELDTNEIVYDIKRFDLSFKANRIKLSSYNVNDGMLAFISVPTSGIFDYYSVDENNQPLRIDGLFYWDNARDHGMYGFGGENVIYLDQPEGYLKDQVYNLFGYLNLPNDIEPTIGRDLRYGGNINYNFTPVKNPFGFKSTTSYYLDPTLFDRCFEDDDGGGDDDDEEEPNAPISGFYTQRDNCTITSGYFIEPTLGPTDFPYPPWYCPDPTYTPTPTPTDGPTFTPTFGPTLTPTVDPFCPPPGTPRRYFGSKVFDSVYLLLYDQESNLPLVEKVDSWHFYNKKARKTGLFDIKINNFVFSARLSPSEILAVKSHIEKVIRSSIDLVKPASTVLRKIIWVRPLVELPPMWGTQQVFLEFDDDDGWLILEDGTFLQLSSSELIFDQTSGRTGPSCPGRIIDGAIPEV